MHGMGGSIDNWVRAGYVDALSGELQLILIDSRGFGASGKPHDPAAYTRQAKVSDVCAVLDHLGIQRAHYWGYSMGGSNGWAMGMLRPDRLRSLVLGGYPSLPYPTSERNRVKWESRAKLMRLGMDVYITAMEMDRGPMPEDQRQRLLANDSLAYAAQQIANIDWAVPEDDVRAMTVPALVYSGTNDDYPPPRQPPHGQALRIPGAQRRVPRLTRPRPRAGVPGERHRHPPRPGVPGQDRSCRRPLASTRPASARAALRALTTR